MPKPACRRTTRTNITINIWVSRFAMLLWGSHLHGLVSHRILHRWLHGFSARIFCTDFLHGFFARTFCTDFLPGFSAQISCPVFCPLRPGRSKFFCSQRGAALKKNIAPRDLKFSVFQSLGPLGTWCTGSAPDLATHLLHSMVRSCGNRRGAIAGHGWIALGLSCIATIVPTCWTGGAGPPASNWKEYPEGPARQTDVSRQNLSPHCLEAIFDSQLPSSNCLLKCLPNCLSPHKRGLFFLFQN